MPSLTVVSYFSSFTSSFSLDTLFVFSLTTTLTIAFVLSFLDLITKLVEPFFKPLIVLFSKEIIFLS